MMSGAARFAVVAILMTLACSRSWAAVSLAAEPGFGGVFRLGSAFPLRIEVVNDGPSVRGVLEVMEARGGPTRGMASYVLTHRRQLFLSTQSRKIVSVTVDPDTVARPLRVRFSTGDAVTETTIGLRGRFSSQPLVLLLTRNNVSPVIPLSYESPVPVVSLSLADLPNEPKAYAGVWSVMLYEQSLRALSRLQRRALEDWLTSGGILLVLGGLHYALYQEPSTAGLLPVQVVGIERVDGLPQMGSSYGEGAGLLETFFVQKAAVRGANVLVEERNIPILVEQRRGQGKVVYLALDVGRPPVSEWNGLPALFGNILGAPPTRLNDTWTVWDRAVFTGLIEEFGFITLSGSVVAFLLTALLYLGALVLWYRIWKTHAVRTGVLTVLLGCTVVFFALAGYGYFDRVNHMPDAVLVSSTVIDGDPWSDEGTVHSNIGLFSTRKRDFTFSIDKRWTHLDYFPAKTRDSRATVFIQDDLRSSRVRIPLVEWDAGLFKVRAVEPFPVRIEWEKLRDRYALRLSNLGGNRLTECWLVIAERGFELGDVPPGGGLVREVAVGEPDNPTGLRLMEIPFNDRAREVLIRKSIFSTEDAGPRHGQTAYIIGWVEGHYPEVRVEDQRVRTHHYRLFRASIPLGSEEDL